MKRISHRSNSEFQVIENRVEVPVDRIIEKTVQIEAPKADLSAVYNKLNEHQNVLDYFQAEINVNIRKSKMIQDELEMQRRALVAIKTQRDVDRKRRLQLIMRLKKQRNAQKQINFKIKLAVGASLLLSILSLVIK